MGHFSELKELRPISPSLTLSMFPYISNSSVKLIIICLHTAPSSIIIDPNIQKGHNTTNLFLCF